MPRNLFPYSNNELSALNDPFRGLAQQFSDPVSSFSKTATGLLGSSPHSPGHIFDEINRAKSAMSEVESHLSETQRLSDRLVSDRNSDILANRSSMKERITGGGFDRNFIQDTLRESVGAGAVEALKESPNLSIGETLRETLLPVRDVMNGQRHFLNQINEMIPRINIGNTIAGYTDTLNNTARLAPGDVASFGRLASQLSVLPDRPSVVAEINSIAESMPRISPASSIFGELSWAAHFRAVNPVSEHVLPSFQDWIADDFFFDENDFLTSGFIASEILFEAIDDLLVSEYMEANSTFDVIRLAEDRIIERLIHEAKEAFEDDHMRDIFFEALECHRNRTYHASISLAFQVIDRSLRNWISKKGYCPKANPQNQIPRLLDTQGESLLPLRTRNYLKEKTLREFYASCNNDHEVKKLDGKPNRHGVIHGRIRANSWENSLNTLIFAHTIVKLVANDVGSLKHGSLCHA